MSYYIPQSQCVSGCNVYNLFDLILGRLIFVNYFSLVCVFSHVFTRVYASTPTPLQAAVSVQEYLDLGGTRADLRFDMERGWSQISPPVANAQLESALLTMQQATFRRWRPTRAALERCVCLQWPYGHMGVYISVKAVPHSFNCK